jgi:integrase
VRNLTAWDLDGIYARIIRAAEGPDPTMAAIVMLAALIGAGRGEMCGLRWSDCAFLSLGVRDARSSSSIAKFGKHRSS